MSYIDESGKPTPKDDENEYVLASITIHEAEYNKAESMLKAVKKKYFLDNSEEDIEIHTTDLISGKKAFKDLSVQIRLDLLNDVIGILDGLDCTLNCVLIRKNFLNNWSSEDIDQRAFKLLFERLCYAHNELNSGLKIKHRDCPQYGLLFMDSISPKVDNVLKVKIRNLMKTGTEYVKNQYIIEDMIFIDSRYRSLSQIIDAVAYCIRRYYRLKFRPDSDSREIETYTQLYQVISKKIRSRSNGDGNGVGIKIYPKDKW
ncbi:MAG: DUF3800 domain-containing protein [archaeon]|nr:DUF3800 domain-containing protein [archaeon]